MIMVTRIEAYHLEEVHQVSDAYATLSLCQGTVHVGFHLKKKCLYQSFFSLSLAKHSTIH